MWCGEQGWGPSEAEADCSGQVALAVASAGPFWSLPSPSAPCRCLGVHLALQPPAPTPLGGEASQPVGSQIRPSPGLLSPLQRRLGREKGRAWEAAPVCPEPLLQVGRPPVAAAPAPDVRAQALSLFPGCSLSLQSLLPPVLYPHISYLSPPGQHEGSGLWLASLQASLFANYF